MHIRHSVVRAVAVLVATTGIAVTVQPSAAHAAGIDQCDTLQQVLLFNRSGNHFVSAEVSRTGNEQAMLRSRASHIGPWERFYLCTDGGYTMLVSLEQRARNGGTGGVARVELSFPGNTDGMLRATGADTDGWSTAEQFTVEQVGDGYVSFKSRTAGKYVLSETDYPGDDDGMLRAASADNTSYRTHFKITNVPSRTDGATKPVIFIHGYDQVQPPGYNVTSYWQDFISVLPAGTPVINWCYYTGDTGCTFKISGNRDTPLHDLGYLLAAYIYQNYSVRGIAVDIVAHSMGGLIAAAALSTVQKAEDGAPPFAFVEDVVTLGTPYLGTSLLSGGVCQANGTGQCQDMAGGSAFQLWRAPNAQSTSGTDWTLIGLVNDIVVYPENAAPDSYTWAGHRVIYTNQQTQDRITDHVDLIHTAGTGPYSQLSCNYYDTCHASGHTSWNNIPDGHSPGRRALDAITYWSLY